MMETADLWKRDHRTLGDGLDRSWCRRVLRQREMSPGAVIVGQISGQYAPEMRLVEDDHVIETLAPHGSDQAFDVWILPGAQGARDDFADAHAGDPPPEQVTVDCVPIAQEPARGGVLGKRLNDLLSRPFGGGMFGDSHMYDAPTVMRQDQQDNEYPAGQGRHREEVQRH